MKKTITWQNHQIACFIQGRGEKVLFLHGWPTNSLLWQPQVDALKAHFTTITIDWLGFGQSDKPKDHLYTFSNKKEILHTLLQKVLEKGEKINIVAHDIGGPPAILWASEHPEKVHALMLLNTVIYPFKTKTDALSEHIMHLPLLKSLFVSRWGLKWIMNMNTQNRSQSTRACIRAILQAGAQTPGAIKLKTILEPLKTGRAEELPSLAEKFGKLEAKKFLIIARKDPLCFEHIEKLHKTNPHTPVHYLENCGHFMPIDRPLALNEVLLQILQQPATTPQRSAQPGS